MEQVESMLNTLSWEASENGMNKFTTHVSQTLKKNCLRKKNRRKKFVERERKMKTTLIHDQLNVNAACRGVCFDCPFKGFWEGWQGPYWIFRFFDTTRKSFLEFFENELAIQKNRTELHIQKNSEFQSFTIIFKLFILQVTSKLKRQL